MALYFVNESVQGKSHDVCEDHAGVRKADGYFMFAVADGHGSRSCSRSAVGSEIAVRVAFVILAKLAEGILHPADDSQRNWETELLTMGGESRLLRHLATSIVRDWRSEVAVHWDGHPFTEDELERMGERGRRWVSNRDPHVYGTTLLAGLYLPNIIVLLRQGDGSCFGVFGDGSARSLLDEDERCVGNVTSSLCESDAHRSIRFAIIDRRKNTPLACFLATDGVDKSLAGEDGVADFFRCVVLNTLQGKDAVERHGLLRGSLEELRNEGAGDDASLAGFVRLDAAESAQEALKAQHVAFIREHDVRRIQQQVVSGARRFEAWKRRESQLQRLASEQDEEREFAREYMANLRLLEEMQSPSGVVEELAPSVGMDETIEGEPVLAAPLSEPPESAVGQIEEKPLAYEQNKGPKADVLAVDTVALPREMQPQDEFAEATVNVRPRVAQYGRRRTRYTRRVPIWIIIVPLALVATALFTTLLLTSRGHNQEESSSAQGSSSPTEQEVSGEQDKLEESAEPPSADKPPIGEEDLRAIEDCVSKEIQQPLSSEWQADGRPKTVLDFLLARAADSHSNVWEAYTNAGWTNAEPPFKATAEECVRRVDVRAVGDSDVAALKEGDTLHVIAKLLVTATNGELQSNQDDSGLGSPKDSSGETHEGGDARLPENPQVEYIQLRRDSSGGWTFEGKQERLANTIADVTGFDNACNEELSQSGQDMGGSDDRQGVVF